MAIQFSIKEAANCFRCDSARPSFRVISVDRVPDGSGILTSECAAALVCEDCLEKALREFYETIRQIRIPVSKEETEDNYLTRPIGIVAIPIWLSSNDSRLLIDELENLQIVCEGTN
jgi:hypothetical protein